MEIEICKIANVLEICVFIFISMNIKFQKAQKGTGYPLDAKSKKCLAAALGLASAISFSGCAGDISDPNASSVNESSSSTEGVSSSSSSESLAGVIGAPSSSSVVESSSSEPLGGISSFSEPSSSSSAVDIPLSDTEPYVTAGVLIVEESSSSEFIESSSSSSEPSSSSSAVDIPLSDTEPYVTAGVLMVEESSSSEFIESSSSSSDPLISVDPLNYGPLSGEIMIENPVTEVVKPLSSSEASENSFSASDKKPVNE